MKWPDEEKYIVFKTEDFKYFRDEYPLMADHLPQPVNDAVVIRRQDIFAPPALDAYANSIMVAMSLTDGSDARLRRLQEIADYFHEQADISWNSKRRIPD